VVYGWLGFRGGGRGARGVFGRGNLLSISCSLSLPFRFPPIGQTISKASAALLFSWEGKLFSPNSRAHTCYPGLPAPINSYSTSTTSRIPPGCRKTTTTTTTTTTSADALRPGIPLLWSYTSLAAPGSLGVASTAPSS